MIQACLGTWSGKPETCTKWPGIASGGQLTHQSETVKGRDPTEEQLTIFRRIPLVIIIATSFAHVGVQNHAAGPDY